MDRHVLPRGHATINHHRRDHVVDAHFVADGEHATVFARAGTARESRYGRSESVNQSPAPSSARSNPQEYLKRYSEELRRRDATAI